MQLLYNEFERNYSQLLGKAKKSPDYEVTGKRKKSNAKAKGKKKQKTTTIATTKNTKKDTLVL